jgi:hypothetical protein
VRSMIILPSSCSDGGPGWPRTVLCRLAALLEMGGLVRWAGPPGLAPGERGARERGGVAAPRAGRAACLARSLPQLATLPLAQEVLEGRAACPEHVS